MPQKVAQLSVADNLCKLAREFESGDKVMSAAIRREFKVKSKNDVTRVVVYLMEIIGSRDEQFKALQRDNTDLKEILKLNDINLEEEYDKLDKKEKVDGTTTSSAAGSNGMAATGTNQDLGTGGATVASNPIGAVNVTT
jgi:SMC interacting uncharacterized protein involved in chromosome segregation